MLHLLDEVLVVSSAPGCVERAYAVNHFLVLGLVLFCGDLSRRAFSGMALFPRAAPTGGILLMLGWLLVGISAVLRLRA